MDDQLSGPRGVWQRVEMRKSANGDCAIARVDGVYVHVACLYRLSPELGSDGLLHAYLTHADTSRRRTAPPNSSLTWTS